MNRYSQLSRYGAIAKKLPFFTVGKIFFVVDSDESYYKDFQYRFPADPDGVERVYSSLSDAYDATVSGRNDVILLDANSTHELSSMLTVSKSRVHFFGMDSGGRITAQGAKIQLTTAGNAADNAATIKVTGTRTTFRNLKIINSGTHANSVAAMIDQGEGTLIEDCSILKLTDLNVATVADFICRADSPTYRRVEYGFDTLVQSAARPTFWFKKDGTTRAKHIRSEDCTFVCSSSESTKSFIKVEDSSSLAFTNVFVRPVFTNALIASASAAALDDAVTSASGLVEGSLLFVNPASDTTEFCSATTDQVKTYGPVTSAQAGEAGTPS